MHGHWEQCSGLRRSRVARSVEEGWGGQLGREGWIALARRRTLLLMVVPLILFLGGELLWVS